MTERVLDMAHLDPWCIVPLNVGAINLFGFALSHPRTGGLAWLSTSELLELAPAHSRARTRSGQRYALGRRFDARDVSAEGEEARLAFDLLVGQEFVGGPDLLNTDRGWLAAKKVARPRFSSDSQRDESIDDQLRTCRVRSEREGWTITGTYTDHAISGATTQRSGYQALMAALSAGAFDIIVAESLDRFSRDFEHIASFHKRCEFHQVRIHTLAEGDISELHIGLKGTMGALYLKELADKTRRGLEGRIHAGRCTGPAPYGYTVVRSMREDGELDRGLRAIDPAVASIVRRIFTDYAAGVSPRKIAQALNADGVPGPGGGIWYDTSIRGREKRRDGILRNALYVGKIVWRRRRNMKDPATGARVRRDARPESFVTANAPLSLRIIEDDLWERVQARLHAEAAEPVDDAEPGQCAFWNQRRPRHLLSGKVICGACGRPFRSTGKDYLGCRAAKHGACTNRRTVRRGLLEAHAMDILGRRLMRPDLLAAFVQAFNAEWHRLDGELRDQAALRQRERQAIERKIANLVEAISDGRSSPAILAKVEELEAARDLLPRASLTPRPAPPAPPGHDLGGAYAARITGLVASLAQGKDAESVEIARRLIDQVIIHPPTDDDPTGIEFIGDLLGLLKAAGLCDTPGRGEAGDPDPAVELFVSSVKEGLGAAPLAFFGSLPNAHARRGNRTPTPPGPRILSPLRLPFRQAGLSRSPCIVHQGCSRPKQMYQAPALPPQAARILPPRRRRRPWRLLRALIILGVWGGLAAFLLLLWFAHDLPRPEDALDAVRRPSLVLQDRTGHTIAAYGDVVGEALRLTDLPQALPQAAIAIEDRRFWTHAGFDPWGMLRAATVDVLAGRVRQGGSTITQQVAKTLFLSNARTLRRKVQEFLLTLWLERHFSKSEILEIWLNRVYLGSGAWGVDAAAHLYFGVSARHLSLWQCAMLAGLPRAPSRYNPRADAAAAAARTREVLQAMVQTGAIPQRAADQASQAIQLPKHPPGGGWFADWAATQTASLVPPGTDAVLRTTLDARLQSVAETRLAALLDGPGRRAQASEGAVAVLDAATGAVRALVGGREYEGGAYDRATLARRQPGSAFKPFVFLAALEHGVRPDDPVLDAPIRIGNWSPADFEPGWRGQVSVEQALAQSLNTAAVRLELRAGGPRAVAEVAHRLGIAGKLPELPSLALGTGEVGLLELTAAYAAFFNGGLRVQPQAIESAQADGKALPVPATAPHPVMRPEHAAMMLRMMQAVVRDGTGRAAAVPGRVTAGKTGTTQDNRDAWFVGTAAGRVIGIWVGRDDGRPMRGVMGGGLPALLFRQIAAALPAQPTPP